MNIDLKGVTFSVVLAAFGVALLVMAVAAKLSIASNAIEIGAGYRPILIVVGSLLIAAAIAFQLLELRKAAGSAQVRPQGPLSTSTAEAFFMTLDDEELASFPKTVAGAMRLQILARTVVNLVGQYGKTFAELADRGAEVEILIVDPASESARHLYGNNYELYRRNAQTALAHLKELQDRSHGRIRVRVFPYVPTMSVMNVENRDASESYVQVQLYFIHSAIGRDRPVFRVYRTDSWYGVFREEFDRLWKEFPDADVSELSAKL